MTTFRKGSRGRLGMSISESPPRVGSVGTVVWARAGTERTRKTAVERAANDPELILMRISDLGARDGTRVRCSVPEARDRHHFVVLCPKQATRMDFPPVSDIPQGPLSSRALSVARARSLRRINREGMRLECKVSRPKSFRAFRHGGRTSPPEPTSLSSASRARRFPCALSSPVLRSQDYRDH